MRILLLFSQEGPDILFCMPNRANCVLLVSVMYGILALARVKLKQRPPGLCGWAIVPADLVLLRMKCGADRCWQLVGLAPSAHPIKGTSLEQDLFMAAKCPIVRAMYGLSASYFLLVMGTKASWLPGSNVKLVSPAPLPRDVWGVPSSRLAFSAVWTGLAGIAVDDFSAQG
jgi:hypothetical protein